jgi:hypothetical protein
MVQEGELTIEDRNLAVMLTQIIEIDQEKRRGIDVSTKITNLAQLLYSIYKPEKQEEKKPEPNFWGKATQILDNLNPWKKLDKQEQVKLEEEKSVKDIENRLFLAINKLRSVNTVDSDQNDLEILRGMQVVAEIASEIKIKTPTFENAKIALGKYSTTIGNNINSIAIAEMQQDYKVDHQNLGESLRFSLDKPTSEVPLRFVPITQEAQNRKDKENERFIEQSLALDNRKNQE